MRSMRATLLWLLLGTLAVVMAAAGLLSYRAGLQEAGEMFDAHLVQSTRVLVSLVDEPLSELNAYPGEPIVLRGWHGQAHGVGEALAFNDGHAYENKLAFQVWDAQGRLLLRSDSAPEQPLAQRRAGYEDVEIDGARWRSFTLQSPKGRWFQSAELADIRQELAGDIAGGCGEHALAVFEAGELDGPPIGGREGEAFRVRRHRLTRVARHDDADGHPLQGEQQRLVVPATPGTVEGLA